VRLSEQEPPFESRIEHLSAADAEEFIRPFLKRPLADIDRDFRYLSKHYEELLAEFPDEWVALFECKVVAHCAERSELWGQLERLGLRKKSPIVELMETDPPTLIL
jgi:hypothetical protein